MSIQWLVVQSFQSSQYLLAAINALSIHLKLEAAGLSDQNRWKIVSLCSKVSMSYEC